LSLGSNFRFSESRTQSAIEARVLCCHQRKMNGTSEGFDLSTKRAAVPTFRAEDFAVKIIGVACDQWW
jgi:hypothetical protein